MNHMLVVDNDGSGHHQDNYYNNNNDDNNDDDGDSSSDSDIHARYGSDHQDLIIAIILTVIVATLLFSLYTMTVYSLDTKDKMTVGKSKVRNRVRGGARAKGTDKAKENVKRHESGYIEPIEKQDSDVDLDEHEGLYTDSESGIDYMDTDDIGADKGEGKGKGKEKAQSGLGDADERNSFQLDEQFVKSDDGSGYSNLSASENSSSAHHTHPGYDYAAQRDFDAKLTAGARAEVGREGRDPQQHSSQRGHSSQQLWSRGIKSEHLKPNQNRNQSFAIDRTGNRIEHQHQHQHHGQNEIATRYHDGIQGQSQKKPGSNEQFQSSLSPSSPSSPANPAPPSFPFLKVTNMLSEAPKHIFPNSRTPIRISTDTMDGYGLIMIRTNPEDPFFKEYFSGKKRLFEIRMQIRFKVQPQGTLYLGGEVPMKMQTDGFRGKILKSILAIIKRLASQVCASFGEEVPPGESPKYSQRSSTSDSTFTASSSSSRTSMQPSQQPQASKEGEQESGKEELKRQQRRHHRSRTRPLKENEEKKEKKRKRKKKHEEEKEKEANSMSDSRASLQRNVDPEPPFRPLKVAAHIVLPLQLASDRLVVTKPPEGAAPDLYKDIPEGDADRKKRLQGKSPVSFEAGDIVTFSFFSKYLDLVSWNLKNMPIISDKNLCDFWGSRPLRFVMYDIPKSGREEEEAEEEEQQKKQEKQEKEEERPTSNDTMHTEDEKRYYMKFSIKNTAQNRSESEPDVLFDEAQLLNPTKDATYDEIDMEGIVAPYASQSSISRNQSKARNDSPIPYWRRKKKKGSPQHNTIENRKASNYAHGNDTGPSLGVSSESPPSSSSPSALVPSSVRAVETQVAQTFLLGSQLSPPQRHLSSLSEECHHQPPQINSQGAKHLQNYRLLKLSVPAWVEYINRTSKKRSVAFLVSVKRYRPDPHRASIRGSNGPNGSNGLSGSSGLSGLGGLGGLSPSDSGGCTDQDLVGATLESEWFVLRKWGDFTRFVGAKLGPGLLLRRKTLAYSDSKKHQGHANSFGDQRFELNRAVSGSPILETGEDTDGAIWLRGETATDRNFLSSASRQLTGVHVSSRYSAHGAKVIYENIVLRALWETHWREEYAVVIGSANKSEVYLLLYQAFTRHAELIVSSTSLIRVSTKWDRDQSSTTTATTAGTGNEIGIGNENGNMNSSPSNMRSNPAVFGQDIAPDIPELYFAEVETFSRIFLFAFRTLDERQKFLVPFQEALRCKPKRRSDLGLSIPNPRTGTGTGTSNIGKNEEGAQFHLDDLIMGDTEFANGSRSGEEEDENEDENEDEGEYEGEDEDEAGADISRGRKWKKDALDVMALSLSKDPRALYLDTGKKWGSKRSILNSRMLKFRCLPATAITPWELSAQVLEWALRVEHSSNRRDQIAFFNQTARMKELPLKRWTMTHEQTLSFFLNLYHAILLHARLLVGQPSSLLRWASFGSNMNWEIGTLDDAMVFALTEIEHCVLRSAMSPPKVSIGVSSVRLAPTPQTSHTRSFMLRKPDFRINFALNHMTLSSLPSVAIFRPETLDEQLEKVTADYVNTMFVIDARRRRIKLPRICQWYRDDFGDGSAMACLASVIHLFGSEKRKEIAKLFDALSLNFNGAADEDEADVNGALLDGKENPTHGTQASKGVVERRNKYRSDDDDDDNDGDDGDDGDDDDDDDVAVANEYELEANTMDALNASSGSKPKFRYDKFNWTPRSRVYKSHF